MAKIGWLDSTGMPSGIHITQEDGERTLCGYSWKWCFDVRRWVPYRVGGHRTHRCQTCFQLAKEQDIDIKHWHPVIPEQWDKEPVSNSSVLRRLSK